MSRHQHQRRRKWRRKHPAVAGHVRIAGSDAPTVGQLQGRMDLLNGQTEALNADVTAQGILKRIDKFPIKLWRRFLDAKLPTSALVPGVAPQYEDGPIGWRSWYKLNRTSRTAQTFYTERLLRELAEYQSRVAWFYARMHEAGGSTALASPRAPGVDEMPKAIDPVDLSDVTEPLKKAARDIVIPPIASDSFARFLGITPKQLRTGVAVAGAAAVAGGLLYLSRGQL